jgi:radical SAM protein with 4Fe4S-binding SPASM domain
VTDIPNPNVTGGATEWIFASVQNNGLGTICAPGGCLINFKNQPWQASTVYAVGQQVLDTHFQIQTVRVGGTSRATTPPWSLTACYVSPYGDVFPCVQFPLPTGNVRQQRFVDIWRHSEGMNEVRSIRVKDLTTCTQCTHVGSCTRCPGLAFMEGNMRGPSSQDCEKSLARTGIPSANMLAKKLAAPNLIQIKTVRIQPVPAQPLPAMAGATA